MKKAINEHAEYITVELDRSRPVKKGAATRRRLGEQVAVNTHTMGTSFVRKVKHVQAMCKVRDRQGVWQGLSQDATGSRWQVLSVPRRDPRTTNLKPKQPLIGMIFTNADPRYAGSLD